MKLIVCVVSYILAVNMFCEGGLVPKEQLGLHGRPYYQNRRYFGPPRGGRGGGRQQYLEGQGEYQLQREQGSYRGSGAPRRPFYRRYCGPPPRGYYDGYGYGYQAGPPRGGPRRGRGRGRGGYRGGRKGANDNDDTLKSEPSSTTVESKE